CARGGYSRFAYC
nr:immunoglobulin heavy chain junction region [Mus musculus]